MIFYRILKVICTPLFPLLLDFRITGARHFPTSGPALVVSNHRSYTDPVVLGAACPRPLRYIAKRELFQQGRLFARFLTTVGVVPINRSGYSAGSIRNAVELLEGGEIVCMFPEGGITTPGDLKPGVALVARRVDVPVVPVYMTGTTGMYDPEAYLLRARPVRVDVGRPFRPGDVGDPAERETFIPRFMERLRRHLVREEEDHWAE